jgi:hypothetical protein
MTPAADHELDADRIRRAVHGSAAAEVATVTGDRPETFPLSPFYDPDDDTVVVTSSPAAEVNLPRTGPHETDALEGIPTSPEASGTTIEPTNRALSFRPGLSGSSNTPRVCGVRTVDSRQSSVSLSCWR